MRSNTNRLWPKFLVVLTTTAWLAAPAVVAGLAASTEQTVVIFLSGDRLQAGIAGETRPGVDLPAIVGTQVGAGPMIGMNRGATYYGDEALKREDLKRSTAVKDGRIQDFAAFEKLLQHVLSRKLGVESEEAVIVMNESTENSSTDREKTTQLFFETFNVPAFFMSPLFESWAMAATMADSSTFQETLITRDEYDEVGPKIIHRKSK